MSEHSAEKDAAAQIAELASLLAEPMGPYETVYVANDHTRRVVAAAVIAAGYRRVLPPEVTS